MNHKNYTFYITRERGTWMVVCKETGYCCEFETKQQAIKEKNNPSWEWHKNY
tara:strand:- start:911 stop:1066 length:156 start_codon:yes stop_codon:yes gene_type:complete